MIVQIDSALGEIQFALLLSLLQQTQVTELFLEKKKKKRNHERNRNDIGKVKERFWNNFKSFLLVRVVTCLTDAKPCSKTLPTGGAH